MSAEAWIHIGITAIGYIAIIATLRADMKSMDRRVSALERKHENLPHEYVPRPEMKAMMDGLMAAVADVKGLLQVAIYGGKTVGDRKHEV